MEAKSVVAPLRRLAEGGADAVRQVLADVLAPGAAVHLCHPFGELSGPEALYDAAFAPLCAAMPDLERRELIVIAGEDGGGAVWVGCCGHYMGSFAAPFLGLPPTGRAAAMRFHEFYRIEDRQAVEMQAIWDLPELMIQAGAWPMGPSLGRDWRAPGPMSQDGLRVSGNGAAARALVLEMLEHLGKHAEGGPDAMRLQAFWHPRMGWYGPAGIGTTRGIAGFRAQHQVPFLDAMPDRRALLDGRAHFFGQGDYVGFTAWPGMAMTLTGDGWLGIAPAGQAITMRSLDFWRCEDGLIRENWVLVDLLDVWHQLGVDVLARMRALTAGRAA